MPTPLVANVTGLMPVQIDGFPVDASLSESHDYQDEITQFPVEKGSDITDNRRERPLKVTIEGLVTDTPLGQFARHETRQGNLLPSDAAKAKLLAIRDKGEPVIIVTSLDLYKNMLMKSLSFPREGGEPHQLHFKVEFEQVTFVTNERTTVRTATPGGKAQASFGALLAKYGIGNVPVFTLTVAVYNAYGAAFGKPYSQDANGDRHYTIDADPGRMPDGYVDAAFKYHRYTAKQLANIKYGMQRLSDMGLVGPTIAPTSTGQPDQPDKLTQAYNQYVKDQGVYQWLPGQSVTNP